MISSVSIIVQLIGADGGAEQSPSILANLVLEDTVERIYHQDVFAEAWRGLFLIRGENVVLLGEVVCTSHVPDSLYLTLRIAL